MRKLIFFVLAFAAANAMATEQAAYEVLLAEGNLELRHYEPQVVAETRVEAEFSQAGNQAFRVLADYIFGNNRHRGDNGANGPASEKIAMTAPVKQKEEAGQYRVSFIMPAEYSMETLPLPNDTRVVLTDEPARVMAAIRYSGSWGRSSYEEHLAQLESYVEERGWDIVGDPIWARYDAPWVPSFMRRNEVLLPVRVGSMGASR